MGVSPLAGSLEGDGEPRAIVAPDTLELTLAIELSIGQRPTGLSRRCVCCTRERETRGARRAEPLVDGGVAFGGPVAPVIVYQDADSQFKGWYLDNPERPRLLRFTSGRRPSAKR
jgi:hypothetical protein